DRWSAPHVQPLGTARHLASPGDHPRVTYRKNKRYFATAAARATRRTCSGKAAHTTCFRPLPRSIFFLYTEQMSSIFSDNSWHFHSFPLGRGASYGASSAHLRTSGSQWHGVLPRDR